jgi:hypothetical protein
VHLVHPTLIVLPEEARAEPPCPYLEAACRCAAVGRLRHARDSPIIIQVMTKCGGRSPPRRRRLRAASYASARAFHASLYLGHR